MLQRVIGASLHETPHKTTETIELFVRGQIPERLHGSVIVATNRRSKNRTQYSRWQDSQADLFKIHLEPGSPGRAVVEIWRVDPSGADLDGAFDRTEFEKAA